MLCFKKLEIIFTSKDNIGTNQLFVERNLGN